ncbi:hypothetical protein [Haloferax larsenii]|uniref:Haemolysin XhlA n=1 Tax=Haloferax larsenii TaxID=302484 RepID=A0A1H7N597_HALLR|nr:hypothetical protein [Haloferax larsenii]SEL18037.1 hypothetical protein SAMN04488691_103180 [Haloferax larsenii]
MDDSERDEILWRLDERTERMDARVERIDNRVTQQDEVIDDLDQRVTRNTTILAGFTFGLSSLIATALGKLHALFNLK